MAQMLVAFGPPIWTSMLAARGGKYALLLGLVFGVAAGVGNSWAYLRLADRAEPLLQVDRMGFWRMTQELLMFGAFVIVPVIWSGACALWCARLAVWLVR